MLRPVVAVAASTGGPKAMAELLAGLEGLPAPVVVVQHIQVEFLESFARWMSRASALPVEVATQGVELCPGTVFVAPSGTHCRIGARGRVVLDPTPESLHRPSADELFISMADRAGTEGVGVLLTGMGEDGALGLLAVRTAGGHTIVQDEGTSAVFGMPGAAVRLGAAGEVLPLADIGPAVRRAVGRILR